MCEVIIIARIMSITAPVKITWLQAKISWNLDYIVISPVHGLSVPVLYNTLEETKALSLTGESSTKNFSFSNGKYVADSALIEPNCGCYYGDLGNRRRYRRLIPIIRPRMMWLLCVRGYIVMSLLMNIVYLQDQTYFIVNNVMYI